MGSCSSISLTEIRKSGKSTQMEGDLTPENLSKFVEIVSSCETSYTLETSIIWNYQKKKNHRGGCFEPSHRLPRTQSQRHWYVSFLATLVRDFLAYHCQGFFFL